jgi:hypothetical protein
LQSDALQLPLWEVQSSFTLRTPSKVMLGLEVHVLPAEDDHTQLPAKARFALCVAMEIAL